MNKHYAKGYRLERDVVNLLRERGFVSARTAGSHSPIDCFGVLKNNIILIQCKNTDDKATIKRTKLEMKELNINDILHVEKVVAYKKHGKIEFEVV